MNTVPDNDALVFTVSPHVVIRVVTDCKDMWRKFTNLLVLVLLYIFWGVDWQDLIWIDSDQYRPRVCLHKPYNNEFITTGDISISSQKYTSIQTRIWCKPDIPHHDSCHFGHFTCSFIISVMTFKYEIHRKKKVQKDQTNVGWCQLISKLKLMMQSEEFNVTSNCTYLFRHKMIISDIKWYYSVAINKPNCNIKCYIKSFSYCLIYIHNYTDNTEVND